MGRATVLAAVMAVTLVVGAAACGSDTSKDSSSGATGPACQTLAKPEAQAAYDGSDPAADIEKRGAPTDIWAPAQAANELEVIDVIDGTGEPASAESTVEIQYVGIQQSDCTQFDSSWTTGQPASFPLSGVIPGFQQGLTDMKPGGRRYLVIPAEMAYGESSQAGQPSGTLVFVVDLVSNTVAAPPPVADEAALAAAEARGTPTVTVPDPLPSELTIIDDVVGDGPAVVAGGQVVAHYVGVDAGGTQFDSSWDRGEPATFSLDGVIPGWTQGLVGMKVGGRRTLIIPSNLAYGDDSSTGRPTGTLVFTIDLVGVA